MSTTAPLPNTQRTHGHDRLIYTEDVAVILNRTPGAVRFMIHKGAAPPSALVGGRRMFRESEVWAWINAQFDKADK